jgi:hypothetical protein
MVLHRSLTYVRQKREKRISKGDRSEGTTPRCRIVEVAADPTMELFHWRYALGLCVEEFETGGTLCVSSDVRA